MRNNNGFGIVEMIVILVVTGVILSLGYVFWSRHTQDSVEQSHPSERATKRSQKSKITPERITDFVKKSLNEKYELIDNKHTQPEGSQVGVYSLKQSPYWKPKGFAIHTTYDGGSSLNITTPFSNSSSVISDTDREIRRIISDSLTTQFDLSHTETREIPESYSSTHMYESRDLVCTADSIESQISSTSLACGVKGEFEKVAAQSQKFYNLTGFNYADPAISFVRIENSSAKNYQRASASIHQIGRGSGVVALFYKPHDSDWRFFQATQQTLPCSDYLKSDDIRLTFLGEPCDAENNPSPGNENIVR